MNIASVSPCTQIRNNNKPSFGAVIPVAILYDGQYIITQNQHNQKLFGNVMYKLLCGIGHKTEVGKKIANKLRIIDKDFNSSKKELIRTIRKGYKVRQRNGLYETVIHERFFATGEDANCVIKSGKPIGNKSINTEFARIEHLATEKNLCNDMRNRIKGVKSFIISIVPRIVNKGKEEQRIVYDIQDGFFMLKRNKYQALTGQKAPELKDMTEIQRKLVELFSKSH